MFAMVSALNCSHIFSSFMSNDVFAVVTVLILLAFGCTYAFFVKKGVLSNSGVVLILLGGSLNLLERLQTGCVRDYINFFGLFTFNIYDVFVTCGIVFVLINIWKKK